MEMKLGVSLMGTRRKEAAIQGRHMNDDVEQRDYQPERIPSVPEESAEPETTLA